MRIEKIVFKAALAVLLSTVTIAAYAQGSSINTFSPYSFYGLGDLYSQGSASSRAMGGVGLGARSAVEINYLNPASYSSIKQQTALFHVGLEGQNYYLRSASSQSSYNSFNLSSIALQLPLTKGLGMTFSVAPYSSVGYRISTSEQGAGIWENIGYVHYLYSGSGGVNQYKVGLGWAATEWLSVGADLVYYQGNITRNYQQTILPLTGNGYYLGVSSDNQEHVGRVFANFGLQATLYSHENTKLTLGATYNMGGKLRSKISEVIMHGPYFTSIGFDPVVTREYRSDFYMPNIFGAGLYFQRPKFSAGLDYYYSGWGINGEDRIGNVRYRDTHSVSAGVQFIPNPGDVRRFMNRISYRVGAKYNQYYMVINGQNIDETAITLGLGIPLGMRGVNNLSIGVELGQRGTTSNNLVKENFFKVSVGFSLFGDDYWFRKYKYD